VIRIEPPTTRPSPVPIWVIFSETSVRASWLSLRTSVVIWLMRSMKISGTEREWSIAEFLLTLRVGARRFGRALDEAGHGAAGQRGGTEKDARPRPAEVEARGHELVDAALA